MVKKTCPVDVISVCSASGEIRPLRLRVNIDEIISVKEIPYVGVEARIFLCRGSADGRQWQFALKYTIRAHCWCLMDRVY